MIIKSFEPRDDAQAEIDVSGTSQKVQIAPDHGEVNIRVHNDGTATVWVRFGIEASLTASTTTGISIPAGSVEVLRVRKLSGPAFAAAIAAGATGKVYFTPGEGI